MRKQVTILGVPIDNVSKEQAVDILMQFLREKKNHIVITPNPEHIMVARKDKSYMDVLHRAELLVPDGIGIVIASKLDKNPIKERVAGCDMVQDLFMRIKDTPYTVYLFGAAPGVAEEAKARMEKKYPNLKIIGTHHGYYNEEDEKRIVAELQDKRPDVLLVGNAFPRAEKWIDSHRKDLPVKVSIGIGGSIDIMSGKVKRAPKVFIKLGLEWLYRLLSQPSRIGRMMQLPVFMLTVIKEKLMRKSND